MYDLTVPVSAASADGSGAGRDGCAGSGIGWLPSQQIDPMLLQDLQEPSVVHIPEGLVRLVFNQEAEVREQLAEPDIGGHWRSASFTINSCWAAGIMAVGLPSSARRHRPAASCRRPRLGSLHLARSLAIRVARVTPIYTTSTPSSLVGPGSGHARGRCPESSDLSLEVEWVGSPARG